MISFDIFDTLIFRPFSSPTDMFYLIGEKFDFLDFKNLRVWAEWDARMKCRQKNGHMEVTLQDIWENLAEDTGLDAMEGMRLECEVEEKLCYANPYMLQVWKRMQELGKRLIIVSDMYLPRACIEKYCRMPDIRERSVSIFPVNMGKIKLGGICSAACFGIFLVIVSYILEIIRTVIIKWHRNADLLSCHIRM